MCNLGIVHEALNAPDEARRQYDAACAVARELGDRRSEGQFLNYLGALNAREGRFSEATTCLDAAERLLEEVADRLSIGVLLCNRAEVSRLSGDSALALAILQQAEALARELCAEPDSELGRSIARVKQTLAASA
jgi:tetratricopeptide (TPR) repeat protein